MADAVRDMVEATRTGSSPADPAARVVERVRNSYEMVLPAQQIGQFARWARQDEAGLGRALSAFAEGSEDPEARFERFVAAAPPDLGFGGVAVGSLLNFGMAPQRLPVVLPTYYARLKAALGEDPSPQPSPIEEYRRGLDFASRIEAALRDAGVPIRDMVDVESLISVCARQLDLWAGRGETADAPRTRDPDVYLAACLMFRNEADNLAEWIEFHRLVGVERFFLYDNQSDDHCREVLAPYVRDGVVILHEWPGTVTSNGENVALQMKAYEHCISTHGAEARWIAMIDSDEFLFSPTGRPLPEVLTEYERWPAVAVNTPPFGTNGHVERPAGLVLENFTGRLISDAACGVKCVIDPAAVAGAGIHLFPFRRGAAVDENGYPVFSPRTAVQSVERLRINHYYARSEADLRARHARRTAERGAPPLPPSDELQRIHAATAEYDDAILSYLPDLRAALAAARNDGGA